MIYVGTSGYSYPDWKGVFYPEDIKSRDYLAWYSRHFPFVEINGSYYRMPSHESMVRMADAVSRDFRFSVKAVQSLTHDRHFPDEKTMQAEVEAFSHSVSGLGDQLSCVLLQFPFSFHYTDDNRRYLAALVEMLAPLSLAVEFRNRDWDHPRVLGGLEKRGITPVSVELPSLGALPESSLQLCGETGYVRFHGRNAAQWWTGTAVSRYDYFYSEMELEPWADALARAAVKIVSLFVAFNNHHKAQAVRNADMFISMLLDRGLDVAVLPHRGDGEARDRMPDNADGGLIDL